MPALSPHIQSREPSEIRKAQILFADRPDASDIACVNLAIGNVSRPMHPVMKKRAHSLGLDGPFQEGVVRYTASAGTLEAQTAFKRVIGIDGIDTDGLHVVVTDGGSMAMELMVLATCGPRAADFQPRPLMLVEPAYTNYKSMAERCGVETVSISRVLDDEGVFQPPDLGELEAAIRAHRPAALVIIPADNPTGQYLAQKDLVAIAKICVEQDVWIVSDEAYRQLKYTSEDAHASSVWAISEAEVPGITGSRIGIESASKVWNGCGLRVGALVTDNEELRDRSVAEYTANLCSNAIGQWIFAGLNELSDDELRAWCDEQRTFYTRVMQRVNTELVERVPGILVSRPDASLYSVIDVRNIVDDNWDALAFVRYCATEGKVDIDGQAHTLLVSPMAGFYSGDNLRFGRTQMRMAFVEPEEQLALVPRLFEALFGVYGVSSE